MHLRVLAIQICLEYLPTRRDIEFPGRNLSDESFISNISHNATCLIDCDERFHAKRGISVDVTLLKVPICRVFENRSIAWAIRFGCDAFGCADHWRDDGHLSRDMRQATISEMTSSLRDKG